MTMVDREKTTSASWKRMPAGHIPATGGLYGAERMSAGRCLWMVEYSSVLTSETRPRLFVLPMKTQASNGFSRQTPPHPRKCQTIHCRPTRTPMRRRNRCPRSTRLLGLHPRRRMHSIPWGGSASVRSSGRCWRWPFSSPSIMAGSADAAPQGLPSPAASWPKSHCLFA